MSLLMTADAVAAYLGIARSAAYAIMHRADCPTISWGRRMYIMRDDLDAWVAAHRRDLPPGEEMTYVR